MMWRWGFERMLPSSFSGCSVLTMVAGSRNRAVSVWEELCTKIRALSDCAFYGYARVSTDRQSLTAQVAAVRKHGAGEVFREVASRAKTDRAQLRRVLDQPRRRRRADGDAARPDRAIHPQLLNTLAAITGRKAGSARSATHGPIPPRRTAA
jgi:predicted site-specific integrase-resolvase